MQPVLAAGCGPGWHDGLLGRGGPGIVTERSTMPGPGSDSHSPERSDSAVRLRAALKMGCSPQRRWKLFCSRQLPSGGGNVHFKARDPRPRWGPPASPCPHPDRDGWRSHGDAGSQKAGGEAESDPSASIHVQAELTLGGKSACGSLCAACGGWTWSAPRSGGGHTGVDIRPSGCARRSLSVCTLSEH